MMILARWTDCISSAQRFASDWKGVRPGAGFGRWIGLANMVGHVEILWSWRMDVDVLAWALVSWGSVYSFVCESINGEIHHRKDFLTSQVV